MEKNIKTLICEIIIMLVIIVIAIPICVNASINYNNKKNNIQKYSNIAINIENRNSKMVINLNNHSPKKQLVNLILKTSKFSNDYTAIVDNKAYKLKDIAYTEDKNNYYFNLGNYEIKNKKDIEFSLELTGNNIYDDSITYSFMTEVANW